MIRTGIGYDTHCFSAGRRLVLGGVEIRHDKGLTGHSDADVLCHAVIDALLGAIAKGDIGGRYPDTDPKWKDAVSIDLLKDTADFLRSQNWRIVNVDSTVVAETPRLASYIETMRKNLSDTMNVNVDGVSIKASTAEGMGALGRSEGIAVMAVVTVESEE